MQRCGEQISKLILSTTDALYLATSTSDVKVNCWKSWQYLWHPIVAAMMVWLVLKSQDKECSKSKLFPRNTKFRINLLVRLAKLCRFNQKLQLLKTKTKEFLCLGCDEYRHHRRIVTKSYLKNPPISTKIWVTSLPLKRS